MAGLAAETLETPTRLLPPYRIRIYHGRIVESRTFSH